MSYPPTKPNTVHGRCNTTGRHHHTQYCTTMFTDCPAVLHAKHRLLEKLYKASYGHVYMHVHVHRNLQHYFIAAAAARHPLATCAALMRSEAERSRHASTVGRTAASSGACSGRRTVSSQGNLERSIRASLTSPSVAPGLNTGSCVNNSYAMTPTAQMSTAAVVQCICWLPSYAFITSGAAYFKVNPS